MRHQAKPEEGYKGFEEKEQEEELAGIPSCVYFCVQACHLRNQGNGRGLG